MTVICSGCHCKMDLVVNAKTVVLKREKHRVQVIHGDEWRCPGPCRGGVIVISPSVEPYWTTDLNRMEEVFEIGKHEE